MTVLTTHIIEVKLLVLAVGRILIALLLPLLPWLTIKNAVKIHLYARILSL